MKWLFLPLPLQALMSAPVYGWQLAVVGMGVQGRATRLLHSQNAHNHNAKKKKRFEMKYAT